MLNLHTVPFALLICILAMPAAAAKYWDEPASAPKFEGQLSGQVKWVPGHTNHWFVFVVEGVAPETGDAASFQDVVGKTVRISVGKWETPTRPDRALESFVKSLKPNQKLAITVKGKSDSTFSFNAVPGSEASSGSAQETERASGSSEAPTVKSRDAEPAEAWQQYTWDQVPIGGGGYSVGVEFHPTVPDLVWLRTDVAGAQLRKPDEDRWRITTQNSFTPEYGRMSGSPGLAMPADNPAAAWMAIGGGSDSRSGIYYTEDFGNHWTRVLPLWADGNKGGARKYGPAMASDPKNPRVVYYASQQDGLWYTRTGGRSEQDWQQVSPTVIPPNDNPGGQSRSVVIDPTGGTVGQGDQQRSAVIYVAQGDGVVYRSGDGGDSWEQLPGKGDDTSIRYMSIGANGDLFVAHGKVSRWSKDGSGWTNVTPEGTGGSQGVSASPYRAGDVIALFNGPKHKHPHMWRSRDNGRTWEEADFQTGRVPGIDLGIWAAPCSIFFDLHRPGRAWFTDAFQVWRTDDVWADTVVWDGLKKGHEETILFDGVSIPGGPRLITGQADIRGFVWEEDITDFGERLAWHAATASTNRTSFDYSENHPRFVYTASRGPLLDGNTGPSGGGRDVTPVGAALRSTDFGRTWQPLTRPFKGTKYAEQHAGGAKIAVSATDPDRVVYLQRDGGFRVSEDGGKTWQDVEIPVEGGNGFLHYHIAYDFRQVLAADRVNGQKFYAYRRGGDGEFYRSTDGGRSFQKVEEASSILPVPLQQAGGDVAENSGTWGLRVAAAPGLEEEVWISLAGSGVWRAVGEGKHKTDKFARVAYFDQQGPTNVAFGPALAGSEQPTVFVFGKRARDGQWGVYRSVDLGESWTLITPPHRPGQWPRVMFADNHEPGTVYVGDASFGVTIGRFNGEDAQ